MRLDYLKEKLKRKLRRRWGERLDNVEFYNGEVYVGDKGRIGLDPDRPGKVIGKKIGTIDDWLGGLSKDEKEKVKRVMYLHKGYGDYDVPDISSNEKNVDSFIKKFIKNHLDKKIDDKFDLDWRARDLKDVVQVNEKLKNVLRKLNTFTEKFVGEGKIFNKIKVLFDTIGLSYKPIEGGVDDDIIKGFGLEKVVGDNETLKGFHLKPLKTVIFVLEDESLLVVSDIIPVSAGAKTSSFVERFVSLKEFVEFLKRLIEVVYDKI